MKEEKIIIEEALVESHKRLVGEICKRIEIWDEEKSKDFDVLKRCCKELIWEEHRLIKNYLNLKLTIGKIIYSPAPKK